MTEPSDKIDVFPDPGFCNCTTDGFCQFLEENYCFLYKQELTHNEYDYKKCDKCKTAYQKAISGIT